MTIYYYSYRIIKCRDKQITKIKENNIKVSEEIKQLVIMSEKEQYALKEVIDKFEDNTNNFKSQIRNDFKSFKNEVRIEFKDIGGKISNVVETLNAYIISNNNRMSQLEGDNKVTKARVGIYITIGTTFIMMAIQLYMSLKG